MPISRTDASAFLQSHPAGTILSARVQPRASRNEVGDVMGKELKIKVMAPPVDAAANEALVRLLAEWLDCSRGSVQLLRGATSRHKQLLIKGLEPEEVARRLQSTS